MKMDGATYQEIAENCGISRQAVHQKIGHYVTELTRDKRGKKLNLESIKYDAFREYFEKNEKETATSFTQKVFGGECASSDRCGKLIYFMTGKHESFFTVRQIKRMCEIIGKPFEEVFKECETNV